MGTCSVVPGGKISARSLRSTGEIGDGPKFSSAISAILTAS